MPDSFRSSAAPTKVRPLSLAAVLISLDFFMASSLEALRAIEMA
jgi:hypothetical protein